VAETHSFAKALDRCFVLKSMGGAGSQMSVKDLDEEQFKNYFQ
jgi:hypothetical protein